MGLSTLAVELISVLALVMGSSFHEASHALAAHLCGDDTAKEAGRLTLNPLSHIDPVGSVLLPAAQVFLHGPIIAFAKPVPSTPYRLKNRKTDEAIVAVAGPLSNLVQALLCAALYQAAKAAYLSCFAEGWLCVAQALSVFVYVNLMLCFFNLLPIPPLDGSKVIGIFLPVEARERFYVIERYAMLVLIVVLWVLPSVAGIDLIGSYLDATALPLYDVLCA